MTTAAALVTVGFQGQHGALAESAAKDLFAHSSGTILGGGSGSGGVSPNVQLVPVTGNEKLFQSVEGGAVEYAIVPIENSHSGTLHNLYDVLLQHKNVHVVGEYVFHEPYCLMAQTGVRLEDIREIRSHPHVLDQCMKALAAKLDVSNITFSTAEDTGASASAVQASGRRDFAAIGGVSAANLYGLNILIKGVENDSNCSTRYYLLGRKPVVPESHTEPRTAFVVALRNQPGTLFKALSCFALRDINVSKFESRPSLRSGAVGGSRPWQYHMFIEVDGSIADQALKNAHKNLEEFSQSVRLLGSFPRFRPVPSSSSYAAVSM